MSTLDELTDEELAYFNSGGKSPLSGIPSEPPPATPPAGSGDGADLNGQQQPPPVEQPTQDDEAPDEGDEVVIVGKDGKPRAQNGRFVPHQALHKEREGHKKTKAELESARVERARVEERLAILNEAFAGAGKQTAPNGQPQPPANPYEEADIDPDNDFIGAFKQLQRRNDYLVKQQTAAQQVQTSRDTFEQVTRFYRDDARKFMASEPNFEGAYRHLLSGRHKELAAMGMADEGKRNAYIAQEETALVIQALQNGQSPSKVLYEYAVARGFTPSASSATKAPTQQQTAAQQKIAQVRAGQQASQSLSNGSGTSAEGLTYSTILNMSDAEFAAAVDGMSKQQVKALLGG